MKKSELQSKMVIYQTKSGAIELRGDELYNKSLNIRKNIFKSEELRETGTIRKFRIVQTEGNRQIEREVNHYNLDMILSVGYRVNSKTATQFRQWATKTLREHITKGYTINKKQISKNYDAFMKSVGDIQALLPEHVVLDPKTVLELIKEFATTWVSLDAYDKDTLVLKGVTKKKVSLIGSDLEGALQSLRTELMKKGEATDMFASERAKGNIEGIVGNVMQSFGGKSVYPTVEEKAAHLLYFMVKNHPFTDGNKRSGAFAFVWFLRKAGARGAKNINPTALTALTLLIAESGAQKKEQMVALVTQMLR